MKKVLTVLFILPFLLACKEKPYDGPKITVEKDDSGALTEVEPITMFEVAFTNKIDSIFYIGDDSCSACQKLKPQLEAWVQVYKGKIYYIPFQSITSENVQYIYDSTVGYYQWAEDSSIPATYFFMQGEVIIKGSSDNTMNFIKKYVAVQE